ncbi:hypothetical protein [Acetobacter fallax]|uniref:Uncharacterized protein n=1 Tax=Acetobacter fallax TaxID=1737473 RepID=A0ABX0KAX8_9PROT|nr:hypothetical protein [Acetobacter fallax]NHO32933.1 hypothetical protein [Acetobacter fallax]NHO36554.1 hypothetical protein [Acetobacter fallax]
MLPSADPLLLLWSGSALPESRIEALADGCDCCITALDGLTVISGARGGDDFSAQSIG